MTGNLNFNDPESIKRWISTNPERHLAQLRAMWKLWPQFRASIEAAAKGSA